MKKCTICNTKITDSNNGFSDLINNSEKKRLLNLKKEQTICLDCKSDLLYAGIISPW
jgi:hypothetical protein